MTTPADAGRDPREELLECRNAIEVVDRRIVALLAQRVVLGLRAAAAKRSVGLPILDPRREADVIRGALAAADAEGLPAAPVREIFQRIVEISRRAQEDAR
jgi:chorismate mutase